MRRAPAILGSAIFLVVAPGIVAGYAPWWICRWRLQTPLLGLAALKIVGAMLVGAGIPILLDAFARFALQGLGTPAPPFPTRSLVVSGPYRCVRNPMYLAVASVIFGQGLFFGNAWVLAYGVAICLAFYLFVRLYEEPVLRATYGPEYEAFCANVPRWIPRLRPWRGSLTG
jgi:protein-S-isoprenylcysteine O-methyltransferase Ste14